MFDDIDAVTVDQQKGGVAPFLDIMATYADKFRKNDDEDEDSEGELFNTHGAVGNKFRKEPKAGTVAGAEYRTCRGRSERQAFRKAWHARTYPKQRVGKSFRKSRGRLDKLKKRRLTFGAIVKSYGGWRYEDGVKGAKRTAEKCNLLGPPWVSTDKFSELTLYTILEHEEEDRLGREWAEFEEQHDDGETDDDEPAAANVRKRPATNQPPTANVSKRPANNTVKTEPASSPVKTENTDEKNLFKDANRVKEMFTTQRTHCEALLDSIASDVEYRRFKNEEHQGFLANALKKMLDGITPFGKDFINLDVKSLKAKWGDSMLTELGSFVQNKTRIEAVADGVRDIVSMHRAATAEVGEFGTGAVSRQTRL